MIETWDWFIQLVEAGSFTRASEKLHTSQQTLSSRLATLERNLETKLVVRTAPLALTRAGEAFMAYAREQREATSVMLRRIGEVTAGGTGNLKVGVSNIRSRVLMPHVLAQFHRSMPGISTTLVEGTNEELVRLAENGDVDIAIARFGGTHPGVEVRRLFQEEIVVALAPGLLEQVVGLPLDQARELVDRQGLAALRDCPFLLTSLDDISGRVARGELRAARIKPNVAVQTDSLTTILQLCDAGLGAAFCPTDYLDVASELSPDLVRVRLSEAARYDISIGRPTNVEPWTPVKLFEDILGALFADEAR